jgi:pimeloyl-ACP methyl ester carboxylesterase
MAVTTQSPERARHEVDSRDWTFGGTWPYEPKWLSTDGIRIHYVDEGPRDGEPVVMLHGNPTWSYLYRRFIFALTEAGFRAVAHDELGFGRSDKPSSARAYSIQRDVQHFSALMDELRLDGVTLVVQDWGGPIGLGWAVGHPDRVKRLVILNTWAGGLPPEYPKPPVWPLKDRGFKQPSLAFWRARFPDADVHEIEDAGHYIQEDAHEHVIPLLVDFLRRT